MNITTKQRDWETQIERAKSRPAMFIGEQKMAHLTAISSCFNLVRKAEAFGECSSFTIHIAPTQYVVICKAKALARSIEELYTWRDKFVLTEDWIEINETLREERRIVTLETGSDESLPKWKRYFGSSTGPTLDSPTYPAILAREFTVAYRLSDGYWCQGFNYGNPETVPQHIQLSSSVSLLAAGTLDEKWFTGLPYTENDAKKLETLSNVDVRWHPQNTLLLDGSSLKEVLAIWL